MNKKGAELSVNVIIVAAIGLAVLVVLFMIFTGRLGLFSKGVAEATSCAQACQAAGYSAGVISTATSTSDCVNRGGVNLVGYYADPSAKTPCCCNK